MVGKTCKICGFLKPHKAKGMCNACYQRYRYNTNSEWRENKKQTMRTYIQNIRIKDGMAGTFSFGMYLRKQLGVL